jgi:glycosyltransferase involved in cell wall biosynthesis
MATLATIEVVIPVFEPRPALLEGAIAGALSCPGVRRVIVVDDGSEPPIEVGEDERVLLLRQAHAGASTARNIGLDRAEADYVLLLDHDDEPIAAGVAAMIELARKTDAGAVVAARVEIALDGGERLRPVPEEWAGLALDRPGRVFRPIALFGASGTLLARRVWSPEGAGLRFDESLMIGEDRDYLCRLAGRDRVVVCGEAATRVRLGGVLTSRERFPRRVRDHLAILERHFDTRDEAYWHNWTVWLANNAAKARVDRETWGNLVGEMRRRGWPVPLKARVRRLTRGARS